MLTIAISLGVLINVIGLGLKGWAYPEAIGDWIYFVLPPASVGIIVIGRIITVYLQRRWVPPKSDVQARLAEIEELKVHPVQYEMFVDLITVFHSGPIQKIDHLAREAAQTPDLSRLKFVQELHALFVSYPT